VNPLRRFIHNPEKILSAYVSKGMTVLDVGPAMGFFTIPLARMVGPEGKVICADVQEKMLLKLQKRALAAEVAGGVLLRVCKPASLCLDDFNGKTDFALAFAVVHEVPDVQNFFAELSKTLKPGALCLVAEPSGHVSSREFENSIAIAKREGLGKVGSPRITWSHAVLLKKN
jgi:ubiquinone/menaquinone biosynthesis C-methylase UbiE